MVIITYTPPDRDDESVASSSWDEASQRLDDDTIEEEVREPIHFSYSQLRKATENFSHANRIGPFWSVYKGTLSNKREIAVKKFSPTSHYGTEEFLSEISALSELQHPNLVKLYGFCTEPDNQMIVTEYVKNSNLSEALFGVNNLHLDWKTRYNLCIGIARGLSYLHEEASPRIIHRDVKPYNILLDMDLNPKICDFGLAKQYDDTLTHLSTRISGTMGYMAPEYAMQGYITEKIDVYAFGVVTLEILSGQRSIGVNFHPGKYHRVWSLYENNCEMEILDPKLTSYNEDEASRMIRVSLLCIQASPLMRPSMSQVVAMLTGNEEVTSIPERPAYISDVLSIDIQSRGSNSFLSEDRSSGLFQPVPHSIDDLPVENNVLDTFSYAELKAATGDFCSGNKLGQGGFGPVFKGTLADDREIAVKKLLIPSPHGKSQFLAEISVLSAVQHCHVVKLYGYCIEEENRLLVYEYLKNKSLGQALYGKNSLHLDWITRYRICLGVARSLAYFHDDLNPTIIHSDVKASNILLDDNLNPKISDLGLARLSGDTEAHKTTRVGGTTGYLAPEYAMHGHLSEKVDVFAFGVVVFEILSGSPVIDSSSNYLLELAWKLYKDKRSLEFMDPKLTTFNQTEAIRLLEVALLCTQASPKVRPSMWRVVPMLTGEVELRPITEKPSYLTDL